MTAGESFSWPGAVRSLLTWQAPPAGWTKAAALLAIGGIVAIGAIIAIGWTVWGDPGRWFNERRPGTLLATATLITCGVVCLRVRKLSRGEPLARFWFWSAMLFILAGLDDLLRLHEELDRAINRALGIDIHHPVMDHLDDVIVLSYIVPSLVLAWRHRVELMGMVLMVQVLAIAALCFGGMVFFDMIENTSPWAETAEESLKLYAAVLILIAFLVPWYQRRQAANGSNAPAS